jgi:hypothetical protein
MLQSPFAQAASSDFSCEPGAIRITLDGTDLHHTGPLYQQYQQPASDRSSGLSHDQRASFDGGSLMFSRLSIGEGSVSGFEETQVRHARLTLMTYAADSDPPRCCPTLSSL